MEKCIPAAVSSLCLLRHGLVPYAEASSLQHRVHAEVVAGDRPPTLLLLEHPPTITLGYRADRSHLLLSDAEYEKLGIAVHATERGGNATYHGPGQLVGYPIVPLANRIGDYLRRLEAVLLSAIASYGIEGRGNPGYAGVYVGEAKLAAIGIAVRRRVAFHGFALNVDPDLRAFDLIVPCGQQGQPITSLKKLLGDAPPMEDVIERVAGAFENQWPSLVTKS